MLVLRDLRLRYRQTALGVIWVLLQPLAAAAIFALIFGRFARLPSDGQPYVVFALAGLVSWTLLSGVLQRAGNSLVSESRLITKVYFPRLIVPLSAGLSAVLDFVLAFSFLIGVAAFHGILPGFGLLLSPMVLLVELLLAVGVGLWLSALNVRYRDVTHALPFFIQVWLYASPVVYSLSIVPADWHWLFLFNPMAGIIESLRATVFGTGIPWPALAISTGWALVFLVSGSLYFRSVERSFADAL
ncbi:MAG: ABC transporter permease [Opitutaceae bacterium]